MIDRCLCGDDECEYLTFGYPFCRADGEHHRAPECPIDESGRPNPPWADVPV